MNYKYFQLLLFVEQGSTAILIEPAKRENQKRTELLLAMYSLYATIDPHLLALNKNHKIKGRSCM